MRRVIALALVVSLTLALTAPAAEARHAPVVVGIGAALGLVLAAPFIIAGSIVAPLVHPWVPVYPYARPYASPYAPPYAAVEEPVVVRPPVYTPPAYSAAPAPRTQTLALQPPAGAQATTVQYPHGRYELRGDGVYTAYRWVWIPNAPPPPPPPGAPTR